MTTRWKPNVTVAALIERGGKFLLVEEHTADGLRLNNPAGHLDQGETPEQACRRETLEETTHAFQPTFLVGIYQSRQQVGGADITYLRFAFGGELGAADPGRSLDQGIVRTVWMTADEIRASRARHRSPMLLRCIEDYLAGRRYPLHLLVTDASINGPKLVAQRARTTPAGIIGPAMGKQHIGQRVVVGLSGGVDSAVSAYLLKQQGFEVVGVFMKNWEDDDDSEYCSSNADFVDAAAVADVLGIEIEHVNFAAQYKDRVFAEFLREYQAGRTPNPDVLCNAEIKFKAFLDHALRVGAHKIATGHYARVRHNAAVDRFELLKGLDPAKDQSYFLHRLNQSQLARTLFPLGELRKTEVRRMAAEIGLPNARKKDSTGICFIGERPFREFLNRYIARAPGPIRDQRGRVLAQHVGLSFYTIGQRQGLGIGGVREKGAQRGGGDHAPWFVARKEIESNTLWVVQGHDHPWLQYHALQAADASWVSGEMPLPGRLAAKTRYRQADAACELVAGADAQAAAFALEFASPQWAVTPGQSAVLYADDVCLGGGVISAASAAH